MKEPSGENIQENPEVQSRLEALKLVFPSTNFKLHPGRGSDGIIFEDSDKPNILIKTTQGRRPSHHFSEARILYLMNQAGVAPRLHEYVAFNPDYSNNDEPFVLENDLVKLRKLESDYSYGPDLNLNTQYQTKPLKHGIMIMDRVVTADTYGQTPNIDTQTKILEIIRLTQALVLINFEIGDIEILWDVNLSRYLFIDVAAVGLTDYDPTANNTTKKVYDTIFTIIREISKGKEERKELENWFINSFTSNCFAIDGEKRISFKL